MIVSCEHCGVSFRLDDRKVKETGSKVRCSKCKTVFTVFPDGSDEERLQDETLRICSSEVEDWDTPEDTLDRVAISYRNGFGSEQKKKEVQVPARGTSVETREERIPETENEGKKGRYIPFRMKLIIFGCILIGFISAIVIPIEAYRPISKLKELIQIAKNLVGGVEASCGAGELEKMNQFALESMTDSLDVYHSLAFNMLLIEKKILTEQKIMEKQDLIKYIEKEAGKFEYKKLMNAAGYWKKRFDEAPGTYELFRRYKLALMRAKKNALRSGFKLSYFMIMIDSGKKAGVFKDHVAFLLESSAWWNYPTFCGELYKVGEGTWRDLALSGKEGFGNSAVSDPKNFFLPHFVEDEYGSWFSVWMTRKTGKIFNNFSIDFDASRVKELLLLVAVIVFGIGIAVLLITVLVAKRLGDSVTRPITELKIGAQEVSKGNYDYRVPILKRDEFGELSRQFNLMTQGQKERLNLMVTLEKFLSKDLAEKAAKSGLVMGGKRADCTVMFTDFAGFSTITQKMSAVEAVNILNAYFGELIPIVKKYGGFPDKYIGDAIVALFGAPVPLEDHAERAVACAIEMQWKMREINDKRRREGRTAFEMRIGLNSGEVIVGAIGCDMKLEYTSIGETTNLANRMESICEIGHVMIAEGTYFRIEDIFFKGVDIEQRPHQIEVKGYPEPVSCYRVFVDSLKIEKDLLSEGPIRSHYIYTEAGRVMKQHPEEIPEKIFARISSFLGTEDS